MFRAAAIGITVALATTTVHARASGQAFAGQVFGFGDSLVDNGNIPRITGQDVPRSPPYFHGRYSNGPTFVEGLPGLLGMGWRDSNDLAIGGATSGQTVNGGPGLPGFSAQLAQFAANGGRFSAADLPVTWVGANDYIAAARAHAFELLFGDDAERRAIFEPVVREAVTNIAQGVGGMFGLGARRAVVIGLPPLGKAPIMSGGPMEAMADGISAAHNKALLEGLKQVNARTGMNIYFVNADMAFRMFLADPKRYGFDDAVNACLGDPACARASTDVQNRHIFFDDLHPTASTHRLIARIIANQVSAGAGLDRPGKSSLAATDAFSRAILWGSARRTAPVAASQLAGPSLFSFASGGVSRSRTPGSGDSERFSGQRQSIAGGVGVDFNQYWRAGIALGGDDLQSSGAISRQKGDALHAALFAGVDYEGWFASATAGVSRSRIKATRAGLLAGELITGTPKGAGYTFAMETGRRFEIGDGLTLAPIAGVRHTSYRMKAYDERGLPLLTQAVGVDQIDRTVLDAGVQLAGNWRTTTAAGELMISPVADMRIAIAPDASDHTLVSSFHSAPGLLIRNRTPADKAAFGELKLGLNVELAGFISNDLTVATTIGQKGQQEQTAMNRLTVRF